MAIRMKREGSGRRRPARLSRLGSSTRAPQRPACRGRVPRLGRLHLEPGRRRRHRRADLDRERADGRQGCRTKAAAPARGRRRPGGAGGAHDPDVAAPEDRQGVLHARHPEPLRLVLPDVDRGREAEGGGGLVPGPPPAATERLRGVGARGRRLTPPDRPAYRGRSVGPDAALLRPRRSEEAFPGRRRHRRHPHRHRHLLRVGQDPLREPVPAVRDRGARPVGLLAGALGMAGRRPDGDPRDVEPERPRQRRVARLCPRLQRRSEVAARRAARDAGRDHRASPSFPAHVRKVEERSTEEAPWHRRTRRRT